MLTRYNSEEDIINTVKNAGYDIDIEAEKLKQFYLDIVEVKR